MPTFLKAESKVLELFNEVLCGNPRFQPLLDERVKIDVLIAYSTTEGSPALSQNGYKAIAIARKTSPRERAKGNGDCEISIDADWWHSAESDEQRKAMFAHELWHFKVTFKRDDLRRPVIEIRKHDYVFGGFYCIAEDYRNDSQEVISTADIMSGYRGKGGQLLLPLWQAEENKGGRP